jgi:amino-acid N-acetyltransferase
MPSVLALLRGAGLPTADLEGPLNLQVWVIKSKDSLQGVIALERFGSEGLLRSLAVAPEYRNRGLGRELVARLEHDARIDGLERLVLLTETAEPFFRSIGYQITDRDGVSEHVRQSGEFRSLCPTSAICMSKKLLS